MASSGSSDDDDESRPQPMAKLSKCPIMLSDSKDSEGLGVVRMSDGQLRDQDSVFYKDGQDDIEDQGSPSYTSGDEVPMSDSASSVGPSTSVDASETEELSTAMTADTANHNNILDSINSTAAECLLPIPIHLSLPLVQSPERLCPKWVYKVLSVPSSASGGLPECTGSDCEIDSDSEPLVKCMCSGCDLKVRIQLHIQRDRTNLILVALFLQGPKLGTFWCMVL